MAHKKAGGAKAGQGGNVIGKRLGLKVGSGQLVKTGQIILRQRGQTFAAGENVGVGKDFTLFAKIDGFVRFVTTKRSGGRKKVDVIKGA